MAARAAETIHEALVRLYREGHPIDAALRPAGQGCGVTVAWPGGPDSRRSPTPEAVAARLRGREGVRDARVAGALLVVDVTFELAWEAVEARLARPTADRPRDTDRSGGTDRLRDTDRPGDTDRLRDADRPGEADRPGDTDRSPRRGPVPEHLAAAQAAHARCARALRTAHRAGVPENPLPTTPETPLQTPPETPLPTSLKTACRGENCSPDCSSHRDTQFSAKGEAGAALLEAEPTAARVATLIADQPRVLGPHRLTGGRATTEHLRALTRATDSWLDREPTRPRGDQPPTDAHAAACRLTLGARIALADVLHTLGEAAPDRM